ncbi:hypothetical protein AMS68_001466 [Peltaster fructicola]|uniref:Uncharacterized protein n=1 Tax=Peltaster fructicola TaxID=286661 RepID=A0A6H0XMV1_9PEZI|nr:hypothetical protein AMS68_001466 [Peltaster fructicola]
MPPQIIIILLCLGILEPALAYLTITPLRALPHVHSQALDIFGALQNRAASQDQCDGREFFCPTGTCFTYAATGYIGCCSTQLCVPRTRCIEYDPTLTAPPCDRDTGGCLYCSNSDNPYCMTITNVVAHQWIQYCATTASTETVSYSNPITTGSQWSASPLFASESTTSTSSSSSSTAQATITTSSSTSSSSNPPAQVSTASVASQTSSSSTAAQASSSSSAVSTTTRAGTATTIDPASTSTMLVVTATNSTLSGGAIGGIVAGAVCGIGALAAAVVCLVRRRSAKNDRPPTVYSVSEKQSRDGPVPPNGTKDDPVEAEGSTPQEPSQFFSPSSFSQHHEADSRPVSMLPHPGKRLSFRGLGIGSSDQQKRASRYTISNPDPTSPNIGHGSPEVSPVLSQGGSSPPSLTQPATPKAPATDRPFQYIPYTPSMYAADPPGSIPHPGQARPPSLPQPYSAAAMSISGPGSARPAQTGLYRGLSSRTGEATPPWAYLSPESAVNGGWTNGHDGAT